MEALPPVAKSFVDFCTKCDAEKYHRVLVHVDEFSAKVQCEICGKKKTFSLKAKKPAKAKAKKGTKAAKSKAQVAGGDWKMKADQHATDPARTYSIKEKFKVNEKLQHSKFGTGFVTAISGNRITALFEDGEKTLVHEG